jgi:hypothetical protein
VKNQRTLLLPESSLCTHSIHFIWANLIRSFHKRRKDQDLLRLITNLIQNPNSPAYLQCGQYNEKLYISNDIYGILMNKKKEFLEYCQTNHAQCILDVIQGKGPHVPFWYEGILQNCHGKILFHQGRWTDKFPVTLSNQDEALLEFVQLYPNCQYVASKVLESIDYPKINYFMFIK